MLYIFIKKVAGLKNIEFIATKQRVVTAKRQQRGLVALTIRGSVLFYSSDIWRPDFSSVNREFRNLYGVDSIELKTLFYRWKCAVFIMNIEKIQKVKEKPEDASFIDI